MNECCKNCEYYEYENIDDGYVCVNIDSGYCADWVDADFSCLDFEQRSDTDNE